MLKARILSWFGWHTDERLVVLESDDWGSIRMSSRKAYEKLRTAGVDMGKEENLRFNLFDTLENAEDLEALFELLHAHRDSCGRPAVVTPFALIGNPDFEQIRNASFETYKYERLPESFHRLQGSNRTWKLWKEGIERGLFNPEFHGREHLNVRHWMNRLKSGDQQTRLAFEECIWGFNNSISGGISYQAAFDFEEAGELRDHQAILTDGLSVFEQLFGKKARAFVPPNGYLHESLYPHTKKMGIDFVYGSHRHMIPVGGGRYRSKLRFSGWRNAAGQQFIIRNAFFEPSAGGDQVSFCLRQVETAFRFRKPAVIGMHRVNFVGGLSEENRRHGLSRLNELLTEILKRWPDVRFLSTTELGQLMMDGHA